MAGFYPDFLSEAGLLPKAAMLCAWIKCQPVTTIINKGETWSKNFSASQVGSAYYP
jgi:hypothetical protein